MVSSDSGEVRSRRVDRPPEEDQSGPVVPDEEEERPRSYQPLLVAVPLEGHGGRRRGFRSAFRHVHLHLVQHRGGEQTRVRQLAVVPQIVQAVGREVLSLDEVEEVLVDGSSGLASPSLRGLLLAGLLEAVLVLLQADVPGVIGGVAATEIVVGLPGCVCQSRCVTVTSVIAAYSVNFVNVKTCSPLLHVKTSVVILVPEVIPPRADARCLIATVAESREDEVVVKVVHGLGIGICDLQGLRYSLRQHLRQR